ncbi:MAG: toxin-antitoxin system YwqK family antitoxin [Planctomycetota bacterium]
MSKALALVLLALGGAFALGALAARPSGRAAELAGPTPRTAKAHIEPPRSTEPAGLTEASRRGDEPTARSAAPIADSAPEAPAPSPAPPPSLVDGEELRAHYDNGNPEFEGWQILDGEGRWQRHGAWLAWHENGQLHEDGSYADGEEAGLWRWYYDNGAKMAEGNFLAGERVGKWLYWHDNGHQMTECHYVDGKAHGLWTHFHENGARSAQGEFRSGSLHGSWTVWREDGTLNLEGTGTYERGDRVGD